jgi:hypothetical protein
VWISRCTLFKATIAARIPPERQLLSHLDPASSVAIGLLIFALGMVIMFEATNGFHDAANAGSSPCR